MKPIVLCILDGCGVREDSDGNAFKNAKKPNFDYLWNKYPHNTIEASGIYVGLPEGQMGNSEVGHMNIGSGRVVYQDLVKINKDIESKKFFEVVEFNEAIDIDVAPSILNSRFVILSFIPFKSVITPLLFLYA